jgi:hypothetical protein
VKAIIIGAGLLLAGTAHAQPAPVTPLQWTIMGSACTGAKECAIGLMGKFSTRDQCLAANQGKLQVITTLPDGRKYTKRCEILTDGPAMLSDVPAAPEPSPGQPQWTIFRHVCVKMSPTSGQCAVGLVGKFSTLAQCAATNQGKEEFQTTLPDGRLYGQYCQALLERPY